jgi:hypothetical protein
MNSNTDCNVQRTREASEEVDKHQSAGTLQQLCSVDEEKKKLDGVGQTARRTLAGFGARSAEPCGPSCSESRKRKSEAPEAW